MKHIGLVRSREARRAIRYGMKMVSCKRGPNHVSKCIKIMLRLSCRIGMGFKAETRISERFATLFDRKTYGFTVPFSTQKIPSEIFRAKFFLEKCFRSSISILCEIFLRNLFFQSFQECGSTSSAAS